MSNSTKSNAGRIWRRLSVSQKNAIVSAQLNDGVLASGLRHSAAEHLEQEGLVRQGRLTELGVSVAINKPS